MLENYHETIVITQNVDDLHERAGSTSIIHLHGELLSVRSEMNEEMRYRWDGDLHLEDVAKDGYQLRPDIVWFGEMVPGLEEAYYHVENCDILIIIGTTLLVYPAAGLINFAHNANKIYIIDPNLSLSNISYTNLDKVIMIRKQHSNLVIIISLLLLFVMSLFFCIYPIQIQYQDMLLLIIR